MICPGTHEWYEMERGSLPREEAERLRRHLAECPACRARAENTRDVAAALENLVGCTRVELPAEAGEAVLRRGRVHSLIGRRYRRPLVVRLQRSRWVRRGLPLAAAVAGAALILIGLQISGGLDTTPRGALDRLVSQSGEAAGVKDIRRLEPLVRAAVSEEIARAQPSPDQVADLLLASYIGRRPREDRQVADFRFLVASAWARHHQRVAAGGGPRAGAVLSRLCESMAVRPMLASVLLPQAALAGADAAGADPMTIAKRHVLDGDYAGALAALPPAEYAPVLKAWCLESLGRSGEAAQVLAGAEGALSLVLRADLALAGQDVAGALRHYEMLAAGSDRYWFAAGYLCRYELADARAAGVRFQQVRDADLRDFVSRNFQGELVAAAWPAPDSLFAMDFDSWDLGAPTEMALVRTRGGEFRVVDSSRGKALEQDEVDAQGAEFLVGDADWSDYTLRLDVRVLASRGDWRLGAAAYRRADGTGYVLALGPGRLGLVKQLVAREGDRRSAAGPPQRMLLAPEQAQMGLDEPLVQGWWYTVQVRVQHVAGGVSVAGKMWRTDAPEPLAPQVVWTDTGQVGGGPLVGGLAGVQISGAKVQIDNVDITRNEAPRDPFSRLR
ncbi:MAG: zf-HC2 domain-containing protein [Planctomycetes bacterium]|nr:zf-HC2 domain-containing protein [Planctomycetota bacterium]